MKCVKNVKGAIRRVGNHQAATYVKSGDWMYISKSEWKADRKAAAEKKTALKSKASRKDRRQQKHKSQGEKSNG